MGVPGLIVVVNKMDSVGNDQDRFDEIKAELQPVIRRAGYKVEDVAFIPVSAWPGHNIVENHEDLAWYHGPSLLQAIDRQEEPPRMFDAALRLPVADVYKIAGVGTVVTGRIVSGTMSVGDTVRFCGIVGKPVDTTVESIEMHHEMFEQALTGDNVGFKVNAAHKDLKRGMVLSRLDSQSAECVDHFTARLVILDHPGQLRTGYTPVIDIGSAHVTCRWTEILEKYRNNPNDKEENPAFVRNGDKCLVRMVPQKPLVVEEYRDFPSLGRFAIREGNHIVAIGRVEAVNRTIQEVERGSGMITKSAAKK
jgi:elongation factor 1-alpha